MAGSFWRHALGYVQAEPIRPGSNTLPYEAIVELSAIDLPTLGAAQREARMTMSDRRSALRKPVKRRALRG